MATIPPSLSLTQSAPRLGWLTILSLGGVDDPVAARLRNEQLAGLNRSLPLIILTFMSHAAALAYNLQSTPLARIALLWLSANALMMVWAVLVARRNARTVAGPKRTVARLRRVAVASGMLALLWNAMLILAMPRVGPGLVTALSTIQLALIGAGAFVLVSAPLAAIVYLVIFIGAHGLLASIAVTHGFASPHVLVLITIIGVAIVRGVWQQAESLARQVASAEEFRERGEVIRLLLNDFEANSSDWLWEVDLRGHLTHVPPRFASLLGRDADTITGERLSDCLGHPGGAAVAEALAARRSFRDLVIPVESMDEVRWWSLSASPTFDQHGVVNGFRGVGADVTEARRNQEQIARMASSDGLTGLANRAALRGHIQSALEGARASEGRHCAVLLIDLDRFKSVNDTLGHHVGDELLREVAQRLRRDLSQRGEIARLGGDEFAIVMPNVSAEAAHAFGTRMIDTLSETYAIKGNPIRIGASIGIAMGPLDGETIDDLLRAADLALYRAKDDGRGVARMYQPELSHDAAARRELEFAMRSALRENQLSLLFQPIVHILSGDIIGFEALLRWQHPKLGQVPPITFIPVAEDLGLMDTIGEWVIRTACAWASKWPRQIGISVNLSPSQLVNGRLPGVVLHALAVNGIAPDRLELEVTENIFLNEDGQTREALAQLASLGVRIGLDDFGTGYSSLGYLRNTVFNTIKIDRCFVREAVDSNSQSAAIVRHIVGLAASLGMDTVAEGAETIEELNAVRELGCGRVQGYFTGRPMTAEAATALVGEERVSRAA